MNKYIKYAFALALPSVALSSCDDYLDTMPDNRATIDTEDKIKSLLVSAYPTHEFSLVCEMSSDNCDDAGPNNPYTERYWDDAFAWKDEVENFNESLSRYWEDSYNCIASANEALEGIKRLGGPRDHFSSGSLFGSSSLPCLQPLHARAALRMPWTQNAAQNSVSHTWNILKPNSVRNMNEAISPTSMKRSKLTSQKDSNM